MVGLDVFASSRQRRAASSSSRVRRAFVEPPGSAPDQFVAHFAAPVPTAVPQATVTPSERITPTQVPPMAAHASLPVVDEDHDTRVSQPSLATGSRHTAEQLLPEPQTLV